MRKLSLMVAALVAAATCAPAGATSNFTAQQYARAQAALKAMQTTNLVVLGDAKLSSDVEGKVYVGGNLTGSGTIGVGRTGKSALASALARTVTVGGNMAANVNVNNGIGLSSIELAIGGNSTGQISLNNGSVVSDVLVGGSFNNSGFNPNSSKTVRYGTTATNVQTQDKPYIKQDTTLKAGGSADLKAAIGRETAALTDQLSTLSQILGALMPDTTLDSSNINNIHFNFTTAANSSDYAVANISASQLANGTFVLPTYASSKTLIVNVSGASVTFGANETGNGSAVQQNIIWNFLDATTVSVNTAVYGSILAPKATISGNSPINGSVAAKVFQSSGEVHLGTFAGNTGFLVTTPSGDGGGSQTGDVPEPASWMTMLLGFGVTGSLIRRQGRRERLAAA